MRAAIAALLFLLVAVVASSTDAQQWDQAITHLLQRAVPVPDMPACVLVFLGDAVVLIPAAVLAGLILVTRDRDRGIATFQFAAGLAAVSVLAVLLKSVIPHPGPHALLHCPVPRFGFNLATRFSLPSGHTMRATFTAGTALRRHPVIAGTLVLSMMAALVYLGDHWTSDVLAGLCLGWACVEVARRFK